MIDLSLEGRKDNYGFGYSEHDIIRRFPYEDGDFNRKMYGGNDFMITYDVFTAFSLRSKKTPVIVWGKKYRNHRVFVFRKEKPRIDF